MSYKRRYILDNGGDFNPLSSLKILQPGGAVLSDKIIKDLIQNGVNVKTTYGSTVGEICLVCCYE